MKPEEDDVDGEQELEDAEAGEVTRCICGRQEYPGAPASLIAKVGESRKFLIYMPLGLSMLLTIVVQCLIYSTRTSATSSSRATIVGSGSTVAVWVCPMRMLRRRSTGVSCVSRSCIRLRRSAISECGCRSEKYGH